MFLATINRSKSKGGTKKYSNKEYHSMSGTCGFKRKCLKKQVWSENKIKIKNK